MEKGKEVGRGGGAVFEATVADAKGSQRMEMEKGERDGSFAAEVKSNGSRRSKNQCVRHARTCIFRYRGPSNRIFLNAKKIL